MLTKILRLQSNTYWTGIILLFISLIIFSLTPAVSLDNTSGFFILNFCLTVTYFIVLLVTRRRLPAAKKIYHWILLFILLLVSAWSLNREMPIFETSVNWLTAIQVAACAALLLAAFFRYLPAIVNHFCSAILGFGFPLFIYLSFYLFPIYIFSAVASIALGISLHAFVPLFISIAVIYLLNKMLRQRKSYLYSFLAGVSIAIVITVVFCVRWATAVNEINHQSRQAIVNENSDLPLWLQIAQSLPQGAFTEKVLKTGIVYVEPSFESGNLFWNLPTRNFDEPKKHDPLITVASLFARLHLGEEDKVRILEATFDSRHQTQERLWSGDNLVTSNVFTNIQIWSQLQLAYIEKTITVKNNNKQNNWSQQEEAIYTFYLPEGSVVSSLSLWINGIEEKGILTTKEKAAEAYRTIVGVESRDPSVVHWQEGNTVSVRVFPVIAGDNRMFKVGITTPLIKTGSQATFQNIYFKGPDFSDATENIKLTFDQLPASLSAPEFLQEENTKQYSYDGKYVNDWQLNYTSKGIAPNSFSYHGKSYSLAPYQKQIQQKEFKRFILDINNSWTRSEFEEILEVLQQKEVYVFDGEFKKVDAANKNTIFNQLNTLRFSLLPLYNISEPEHALLITKGSLSSPNLNEIKSTPFGDKLNEFVKSGKKLQVINVGEELSLYLKTLREYRVLNYEKATLKELKTFIATNTFLLNQEDENKVVLKNADLVITRSDSATQSTAPDHLMRLFTYNDILRQVHSRSEDSTENDLLTRQAELAHIVTPVSSLVVLETQKDYDRFNIKDSKESLQNASHKKSGAVPEPHEWALIVLAAGLFVYLSYMSQFKKLWCKA
ncbi:MAG TPA: XrtN system VIT domain-containing protein [Segetibacter sp.]|jgi:XrtN system VIT domain protein